MDGDKLKALKGDKCKTFQVDVTSPESIAKFKESIGDQPVDLLLNIAGQLLRSILLRDVTRRAYMV